MCAYGPVSEIDGPTMRARCSLLACLQLRLLEIRELLMHGPPCTLADSSTPDLGREIGLANHIRCVRYLTSPFTSTHYGSAQEYHQVVLSLAQY